MEFTPLSFLGIAAACLTSFAYVPQLRRMWRTKSVQDISILTLFQFIVGCSLWLLYGVYRKDPVIVLSNVVGLVVLAAVLALFLKYRIKDEKAPGAKL